jgi:hypothetical protein
MKSTSLGIVLFSAMALGACGSDSGQSRVVLLLTDAPGDFQQVPVTITKVEARYRGDVVEDPGQYKNAAAVGETKQLQQGETTMLEAQQGEGEKAGDGEGKWVKLMTKAQTHDLLKLQNGKTAQLSDVDVPAGYYDRVRVTLSSAEVVVDGKKHQLKLAGTQIELQFKFKLGDGADQELLVDFDAGKSVKADGKGGYEMDPAVHVKQFKNTNQNRQGEGEPNGSANQGEPNGSANQGEPNGSANAGDDPNGSANAGDPNGSANAGEPAGTPAKDPQDPQGEPARDPQDPQGEPARDPQDPKGEPSSDPQDPQGTPNCDPQKDPNCTPKKE